MKCPQCGLEIVEKKSREPSEFWVNVFLIGSAGFTAIIALWVVFTLFMWFIPIKGNPSLSEVLKQQWEWLKGLRI